MRRAMAACFLTCVSFTAALLVVAPTASGHDRDRHHHGSSRLFVPPPNPDGVRQVVDLFRAHRFDDARLLGRMLTQPQAVWVESGTPAEAERQVRKAMQRA